MNLKEKKDVPEPRDWMFKLNNQTTSLFIATKPKRKSQLQMALARKLKRTEFELFYLGLWSSEQATHIRTFMAIKAISIKALALLLKDSFFDLRSFSFLPLSPVRIKRFFINWSVNFPSHFFTRLKGFLLTYIRFTYFLGQLILG